MRSLDEQTTAGVRPQTQAVAVVVGDDDDGTNYCFRVCLDKAEYDAALASIDDLEGNLQAEADERNSIYRQMVERFREMIDAGTLDVSIEKGRIVINLKQDVLSDSDSARVNLRPDLACHHQDTPCPTSTS